MSIIDETIDTSPPPEKPKRLPKFEGRDVIRSSVKITKAGDGLSDALKVEPVAMRHGQEVCFVLRGEVRAVDHHPVDKGSRELVRVHVIDTTDIAMVDVADVDVMLEKNRDRVQRALDSMEGQGRLDDDLPD